MHILRYTEWEQNGKWHTNDTSDLVNGSAFWWHVPRMLNMELTDYILMLKNDFNAVNFRFFPESKGLLLWDWQSYADCHKFTLFVNREARKKRYFIC